MPEKCTCIAAISDLPHAKFCPRYAPSEDLGSAIVDAAERMATSAPTAGGHWDASAPRDMSSTSYAPACPIFMSTDSATRKRMPVASGVAGYFPDALLVIAFISQVGNDKHNPGEPLHWAKDKSSDEKDAELRHMLDALRGDPPDPGLEELGALGHLGSKAWRALGDLQRACDAERAAYLAGK